MLRSAPRHRRGALLVRGPFARVVATLLMIGPGSAKQRYTLHRVRDTRIRLPQQPSLRAQAKQSSLASLTLDCFVAFAPRNAGDAAIAVHLTRISRPRLICPSCQNVAGRSLVTTGKSLALLPAIPARAEGRLADRHERWVWDAVDALAPLTNGA